MTDGLPGRGALIQEVVEALTLETEAEDRFVGNPGEGGERVYGGMLIAQSYIAAARTVSVERPLHSLHAYFLRAGEPGVPLHFSVERIREGRTFATRQVTARQGGRDVFSLSASFARIEDGFSHSVSMPEVPAPEGLLDWDELRDRASGRSTNRLSSAIEVKLCDAYDLARLDRPEAPAQCSWLRARGAIPADPILHTAILIFMSDRAGFVAAVRPHGLPWGRYDITTLDHALWIHRPVEIGEWLLYSSESPVARASRGFMVGGLYYPDGVRVASVAQEGLIRPVRSRREATAP